MKAKTIQRPDFLRCYVYKETNGTVETKIIPYLETGKYSESGWQQSPSYFLPESVLNTYPEAAIIANNLALNLTNLLNVHHIDHKPTLQELHKVIYGSKINPRWGVKAMQKWIEKKAEKTQPGYSYA